MFFLYKIRFLIKLQAFSLQFIKKKTPVQVFSCEFCKIFKNITWGLLVFSMILKILQICENPVQIWG